MLQSSIRNILSPVSLTRLAEASPRRKARRGGPASAKAGFTLIELLIVIAILAILAAAVVIVINPGEMLAEARDSERSTSLSSLKKSIDLFILDNPSVSLGTVQHIYISIPDTSATCANTSGLPTLPSGWSYNCVTTANLKNLDGTGWLPLNLSLIKGGSPISSLPIDPKNTASTGSYYGYIPSSSGTSFELFALTESEKISGTLSGKDGGPDPARYETGSDISLWGQAAGLIGFWTFDEGSGTTAYDSSGNNQNGTIVGPTYGADRKGISGKALAYDGVDDFVNISDSVALRMATGGSFSFWMYPTSLGGSSVARIIDKSTDSGASNGYQVYVSSATKITMATASGGATTGDGAFVMNNWNMVSIVFSSSGGKKIFLNGKEILNSGSTSLPPDVAGDTRIGNRAGATDRAFAGRIDDFRIYNRALSAAEVAALYFGTK